MRTSLKDHSFPVRFVSCIVSVLPKYFGNTQSKTPRIPCWAAATQRTWTQEKTTERSCELGHLGDLGKLTLRNPSAFSGLCVPSLRQRTSQVGKVRNTLKMGREAKKARISTSVMAPGGSGGNAAWPGATKALTSPREKSKGRPFAVSSAV